MTSGETAAEGRAAEAGEIVVASDLHLGAHRPHDTERHDAAFVAFLESLCQPRTQRQRLLLLGDVVDFLEVGARCPRHGRSLLDTSEEVAREKLEQVAAEHRNVFAALGRVAAAGLELHIVPGNHDVELIRPSAQDCFKELLNQSSGATGAADNVTFHPWIFYVPRLLYAEHGHQHHDINALATLLQPEHSNGGGQLDLPLAAHLVELRGRTGAEQMRALVRVAGALGRKGALLSSPRRARRRAAYHREVLARHASEVGLHPAALVAIDRLSEASVASISVRLLSRALRKQDRHASPTARSGYLEHGAAGVHGILGTYGESVPFYVFGHTHVAEQFPLTVDTVPASYLNCGTWSPALPSRMRRADRKPLLTFVHVTPASAARPAAARVMAWDDEEHIAEPLDAVLSPRSDQGT